jgi:hypothetical protein
MAWLALVVVLVLVAAGVSCPTATRPGPRIGCGRERAEGPAAISTPITE